MPTGCSRRREDGRWSGRLRRVQSPTSEEQEPDEGSVLRAFSRVGSSIGCVRSEGKFNNMQGTTLLEISERVRREEAEEVREGSRCRKSERGRPSMISRSGRKRWRVSGETSGNIH